MYSHALLDQNVCAAEEGDEKEGSDMENMVGLATYRESSPLDHVTSSLCNSINSKIPLVSRDLCESLNLSMHRDD